MNHLCIQSDHLFNMLAFSLYTLTWQEAEKPTLQRVAQQLNIHLSDVDADFGMVCIDEVQKTYCVMISQEALQKIQNNSNLGGEYHSINKPAD